MCTGALEYSVYYVRMAMDYGRMIAAQINNPTPNWYVLKS